MANGSKISNDEGKEKMHLGDIFRRIGKNTYLFLCPESKSVSTINYFYRKELESGDIDLNAEIGTGITGKLIRLPSYEEINHKDFMSFYVKEFVDDKNIRKTLFNILRNHDFMDKFIDAVKELNLYDEYMMVTEEIYNQIAEEWVKENCSSMFSN